MNQNFVNDEPLTTSATATVSPDLLVSDIDSRVVKIRPQSTPLDQISRLAGTRQAGSMVVEYYSVETRPTKAVLADDFSPSSTMNGQKPFTVMTTNDSVFSKSDTIFVPSVKWVNGEQMVLYVVDKPTNGGVTVMGVNNDSGDLIPFLNAETEFIRMGRAAAELDVQTPQFAALPEKRTNNCQIFKAQVEESTIHKMTDKEVGWTFNDQEEVAVIDLRLGMEKSFLFGHAKRVFNPLTQEEIILTGGIWHQTDHSFEYTPSMTDNDLIVDLTRRAFEGASGSRKKILLAGSDLIDRLNKFDYSKSVGARETVTKWGIDFTELCSKFGTLYVLHDETFDHCGMPGYGMVVDPQYLTKYSFIPMQAQRLDLKGAGVRNTDAVVITEASCLVLRYPEAHLKVVPATED